MQCMREHELPCYVRATGSEQFFALSTKKSFKKWIFENEQNSKFKKVEGHLYMIIIFIHKTFIVEI